MSKIWIGCAATAATLAALIVGPGQAAQKVAAAEATSAAVRADTQALYAPAPQARAAQQANSVEQPARAVRVVYPSPFSAQR